MIRPKKIERKYVQKAKQIIKKEAKTRSEANNLIEVCKAMGPYHFVRYKMGIAKEGVDFLDADKHIGEKWVYSKFQRKFVKIS